MSRWAKSTTWERRAFPSSEGRRPTGTSTLALFDPLSFQLDIFPFLNKASLLALSHTHALFRDQLAPFVLGVRELRRLKISQGGHKAPTMWWSSGPPQPTQGYYSDLSLAIRTGRRDVCQLVREIEPAGGFQRWNRMLLEAAIHGSRDLCLLAREWGANNWNTMLDGAISSGSLDLCLLAREWGARNWNTMLDGALSSGSLDLCSLAREWQHQTPITLGITPDATVLIRAIYSGQRAVCCFIYSWIIQDHEFIRWDEVMSSALRCGDIEICKLIYEWSMRDNYALSWGWLLHVFSDGDYRGNHELEALLWEWQKGAVSKIGQSEGLPCQP